MPDGLDLSSFGEPLGAAVSRAPDLSSFGEALNSGPDLSTFGEPLGAEQPQDTSGYTPDYGISPSAEPISPEDRGMVGKRLRSGAFSLGAGLEATGSLAAARQLEVLDRIDKGEVFPPNIDPAGFQNFPPDARAKIRAKLEASLGSQIAEMVRMQGEAARTPPSDATQKFLSEKTWGGMWDAFTQAPATITAEIGLESLPQSAPGLVLAMGAGALAGRAGVMAGMGTGSFVADFAGSVVDALNDAGIDVRDPKAIEAAMRDPAMAAKIRERAQLHAMPVAALDAISAGLAGKVLAPRFIKGPVGREAVNIPAQVGVQGVAGGAGEALGEVASGQPLQPGQIAAEVLGEAFGAPAEVGGVRTAVREHLVQRQMDRLTPEDRASPIPDRLIAEGRAIIQNGGSLETPPVSAQRESPEGVAAPVLPAAPPEFVPTPSALPTDIPAGAVPAEQVIGAEQATLGTTASVPFMITRAMRQQLADLGYGPEQVAAMTPQEANDKLKAGLLTDEQFMGAPTAPAAQAEPAPESRRGPYYEEFRNLLPKDASGDPDVAQAGASIIQAVAGEAKPWNSLTLEQRVQAIERARSQFVAAPATPQRQETAAPALVQSQPTAAPADIHAAATKAGIPFDNDPAFMAFTQRLTGKTHLDAMTPAELATVQRAIEAGQRPEPAPQAALKAKIRANRAPRAPLDIVRFLAANGGIRDTGGELRAQDLHRVFVPGGGPLVRPNGMNLDRARELAQEAGYLPPEAPDAPPQSTIDDLLNAILETRAGNPRYSEADRSAIDQRTEAQAKKTRAADTDRAISTTLETSGATFTDEEIAAIRSLVEQGIPVHDAMERVSIASDDRQEAENAQEIGEEPPYAATQTNTAGEGGAAARAGPQPEAVPAEPERVAPAGEQPRQDQPVEGAEEGQLGPSPALQAEIERYRAALAAFETRTKDDLRAALTGEPKLSLPREPAAVAEIAAKLTDEQKRHLAIIDRTAHGTFPTGRDIALEQLGLIQRGAFGATTHYGTGKITLRLNDLGRAVLEYTSRPTTDLTDQGVQTVLPGAERITDKELAERKSQGRLAPKKPQQTTEAEGLFDTGARKQGSLFSLTPAAAEKMPAVIDDLRARLDKLGLRDASLRMVDAIRTGSGRRLTGAQGQYEPFYRLIEIALQTEQPQTWVLDHEAIHALHDFGVFRDAEWATLSRTAIADTERMSDINRRYARLNLSDSQLIEEAIADMFADWRAGDMQARGFIRTAFERIMQFFEALQNALNGQGFNTVESVFGKVDQGEVGARERIGTENFGPTETEKFSLPRTPEFQRWFGDSKVVDESGAPLVVYHGTTADIEAFDPARLGQNTRHPTSRLGFFFSADPAVANLFTQMVDDSGWPVRFVQQQNANTVPAFLQIERPFVLTTERFREIQAVPFGAQMEQEQPEAAKRFADYIEKNKARLLAQGYDGIHIKGDPAYAERLGGDEYAADSWVAFKPEQIKSVNNRGTFDPTDPRISYSLPRITNPERQQRDGLFGANFSAPSGAVWEHLHDRNRTLTARIGLTLHAASDVARQKMQDKMLIARRVQEAIQVARDGVPVPENQNVYLAEELYHGRTGKRLDDFKTKQVEPLIEAIGDEKLTLEQVEEYLYARHAPERNAKIAEINEDMPDGGSGMTNAEASDVMARFERDGLTAKLERIATRVDAITAATRHARLNGGLIDDETALRWQQAYKNYVPLKGFAEIEPGTEEPTRPRTGKGFDIRGQESRRALGRESRAANILANVITAHEEAIVRVEKNRVGKAFLDLVMANPNADLWEVDRVEYTPRINRETGMVELAPDPRYQLSDEVLAVKVNGEVFHVAIHNPTLARAMKNIGAETANGLLRAMQRLNRWLAFINTSANPEFVVSNFTRDIQTAGVNLNGIKEARGLIRKIMRDVPKAMIGAIRGIRGDEDSRWGKWYQEYARSGAKTTFFALDDIDAKRRQLDRLLRNIDPSNLGKLRMLAQSAEKIIQDVNSAVENGIRLATYANLRQRGVGEKQAASIAKNLTVNFNRKGEWAGTAQALYLFYNASIQGSVRLIHALGSRRVQKIVAGTVITFAMLDIINGLMSPDDDDEKKYDKIARYTKEHNLIVVNPWAKKGAKDAMDVVGLKIPLPYGYNVFAVMGYKLGEVARSAMGIGRKVDPMKSAVEMVDVALNAFNPLGGSADILRTLVPTVLKPMYELQTNKNFMGTPIMPEQDPFGVKKPESERSFRSVSLASKMFAQELNSLTGGNAARSGAIDVSPEAFDHWAQFVTGGSGTFIQRSADTFYRALSGDGKDIRWNDIPFARRLIEGNNEYYTRTRYYEIRDAARIAEAEMTLFRKAHDSEGIAQAKKDHGPEFRVSGVIEATDDLLKDLRESRKLVEGSATLSDEARKAKLDAIEAKMDAAMTKAIRSYNLLVRRPSP